MPRVAGPGRLIRVAPDSSATPRERRASGGGSIDRRLLRRMPSVRLHLAAALVAGAGGATLIVVQAVLLASIVDRVLLHHAPTATLVPLFVGLAGAVAGRALCLWVGERVAQRGAVTLVRSLRRDVLDKALALGPAWLTGERAGELALSATRGVDALGVYFGRYLPQLALAGLVPIGLVIWVGVLDWVSGCVLVGVLVLVPVAMVVFGREATKRAGRQWRRLSSLSARYLELVQGLPTLRALGRSEHGRREVAASTEALRQTTMGTLRVAFLSALALELLSGLGVGLVAMLLGLRLLDGSVDLGTALAVLLVAPEVFLPLRRAGAEFHASTEGRAAATRILDVLDLPIEPGADDGELRPRRAPSSVSVTLDELVVSYPRRASPAVALVELRIDPGEHLAIVGPSGSGKSTLLGVLLGLVRPSAGSVALGGVDLSELDLAAWRRLITWVPQRPRLFRGSLLDNVRFSRPDAPASSVDEAVHISGLDALVGRLPRGLESPVGEGGTTISAGERQRVAIARAVLRDVPLVLLDEPATNLDPSAVGELEVQLSRWAARRTVVVAAHRSFLVPIDRSVGLEGARQDRAAAPRAIGAEW